MSRIDYSVWDHIEVSDDEDDTHPNIDTPSLFRWRHQARVDRMEEYQKKGKDMEKALADGKRKLAEAQKKTRDLVASATDDAKAALSKAQAEEKRMKKEERELERKLDEHRREEKKMPWNVDTLSKEGFSKSVVNAKPDPSEATEEEKEQKHKSFVEKYEKEIKHFEPHEDVCANAHHWLPLQKHALMEQVAHQTIVMQFILELAKSLKVDPRGCFRQFFAKIKEAFNDELESFKSRVRGRAKIRIEKAMKEYEEEERQKRIGPGGLDPVEVYESLPEEAKVHMKRCIESGLWVPNSRGDEDQEEEGTYEELKPEEEKKKKEEKE
ncbi:hypothetical protein CRUP_028715 [Coryphaenoides rupestris]|nr:hypothetical protein CRUP_028715 [Coryphaenoides rupestris]